MANGTLVLGGTRSGKSRYAERQALEDGRPVTVIATATSGDSEMSARIAAHRARRPRAWTVVEEPLRLAAALEESCRPDRVVVVDCLTLWLTNLIAEPEATCAAEIEALCGTLQHAPGRLVLVGNEISLGVVPLGEVTRRYIDCAGSLHQRLAGLMDHVVLLVAGLPLALKGSQ
jgi:adenosylcobinamide kinase/adenosylcobinamide-phosphate guanylyltransferase